MGKPNFIIFITDTQGANVVGCYGHPELRTPNIDRLASQGARFERAYTTAPVCTPARAGLFTGVYSHNSGPWANSIPLYENTRTMAHYFGDAGYHCAYSGKWHLSGHDYFDTGVCPSGWDPEIWFDGKNYLDELSDEETKRWREAVAGIDGLPDERITAEFTWAHRVSDGGIQFLNRDHERPFCLVLSYDEPHHPWACPREFAEPFSDYGYPVEVPGDDEPGNKPGIQKEWRQTVRGIPSDQQPLRDGKFYMPAYFGCNSFVDHEIGRVVAEVDRLGLDEDTYVIFTSDHGDLMGEHGLLSKGACMYDSAARIPLIIRPPVESRVPCVVQSPVSHADLLPTMLTLSGETPPDILYGENIDRLIAGTEQPDKAVFIEFNRFEIGHDSFGGFQPIRCIVRDNYKLAINLLSSDELYNLADDPGERNNLIEDPASAEVRQRLHRDLLDWMNRNRDPFRGFVWDRRAWGSSLGLEWSGPYRPRPDDGAWPRELGYGTGKPIDED
ncbi:MAG: sulfatase-like hydrolase/transferase [Candidatus Pacebacteria bacterium]|nr:sulfatase-like hydrolase/transferase [Candidatus Paceibacterota bacterium]